MITQAKLKEVLHYDPETGLFIWLVSLRYGDAGKVAGTPDKDGYNTIRISGESHRANRLAFLYMTGTIPDMVDHADGIVGNDSWSNLRESDSITNGYNRKINANNTSGIKGVTWVSSTKSWRARINVAGKRFSLGNFNTLGEAEQAINNARIKHHGEFARHV